MTRMTGSSVFARKYARININRNVTNYESGRDYLKSAKSGGVQLLASSYEKTNAAQNQQSVKAKRI